MGSICGHSIKRSGSSVAGWVLCAVYVVIVLKGAAHQWLGGCNGQYRWS